MRIPELNNNSWWFNDHGNTFIGKPQSTYEQQVEYNNHSNTCTKHTQVLMYIPRMRNHPVPYSTVLYGMVLMYPVP